MPDFLLLQIIRQSGVTEYLIYRCNFHVTLEFRLQGIDYHKFWSHRNLPTLVRYAYLVNVKKYWLPWLFNY